jgi:hypothetical protein
MEQEKKASKNLQKGDRVMSEQEPTNRGQSRRELDKRVSINISPNEATEFANRLTYDDQFRASLEANPVELLAEYHIYFPPDQLPRSITLPPKEELRKTVPALMYGRELPPGEEQAAAFVAFLAFIAFFKEA